MYAKTLAVLLALSLALPAAGQVSGPSEITVPVGRLASLPLTVEGGQHEYAVFGADCDAMREYDPDPSKLRLRIIGYSPGQAFVVVSSRKGAKLNPLYVCTVNIGTKPPPGPPPVPPDPPGPPPKPPATVAAWVVMVTDQANDSPDHAAVIASERFRKTLEGWGLKFKVYDKASQAAKDKGYDRVATVLPALLILDKDGGLIQALKCPEKDGDAAAAVAKAVGT
jgi:hypothetical protein